VLTGPSLLARVLGCSVSCECDVVVHVDDLEHVDEKECVWWIEDPTFIYRYVWIRGYPHVALEDLKKLGGKTPRFSAVYSRKSEMHLVHLEAPSVLCRQDHSDFVGIAEVYTCQVFT